MENLRATVRVVARVIQATSRSLEYPGTVANRSKTVKPAVIFVITYLLTYLLLRTDTVSGTRNVLGKTGPKAGKIKIAHWRSFKRVAVLRRVSI